MIDTTIALLAIVVLSSVTTAARADAEAGRAIYMRKGCFECHGSVGQGSIMSGPALAPSPVPLKAMTAYVRAPKGQMPVYSKKILSDEDLSLIHAYLASIPAVQRADDTALLRSSLGAEPVASLNASDLDRGQMVFSAACASCHGATGAGGVGPSLRGVVNRRQEQGIEHFIRVPSGAMPRLYPGVLTEADVRAVAKLVATWK
ncbi:cytochrome c [Burkholderia cenocepacia]|nr:cytochrome c [Burkholderia cenocepacia]RQU57017.1 cytochrome c [Burkholderia cenocepacia]